VVGGLVGGGFGDGARGVAVDLILSALGKVIL